jgi:hypothetical protein
MTKKMTFLEHGVVVMVANVFVMLGFIRRLSLEFRYPFTLKTLWFVQNWNTQVVCGTGSMMCVLTELNACKSGLFDMFCVVWFGQTCMICHRLRTDATSASWHPYKKAIDCLSDVYFRVLSKTVNSPILRSILDLITPRFPTRGTEFLRIDFHRTNSWTNVECDATV